MIEKKNELNDLENFNPMSNPEQVMVYDEEYTPQRGTMTTCTLKNHTYNVPSEADPVCYTFREIILTINEATVSSSAPGDKLYLSRKGAEKIEMLISSLLEFPGGEEDFVGIYLYKENTSDPIWQILEEPDEENDIYIDLSDKLDRLTPGNYFFLFTGAMCDGDTSRLHTMAGHECFSFTLLESGKELPHPHIRKGKFFRKDSGNDTSSFTSGTLQLVLQTDRTVVNLHEYKAECFCESLQLMGNSVYYPSGKSRPTDTLHFSICSQKMWIKGNYFVILSHNDEPFARIDFLWEGASCKASHIRSVTADDREYRITKPYENGILNWETIREIPGATDVKWELLTRENRHRLNRIRTDLNIARWQYNANFILIGPDNAARRQLAEHIPHLLQPEQRATKFKQAGELIRIQNPTNPDEEINSLLHDSYRSTICLSGLDSLQFGRGQTVIRKLQETLSDETESISLCLAGTESEIARFFENAPEMVSRFPQENRFTMQPPTFHELLCAIQHELKRLTLSLSPRAQTAMVDRMDRLWHTSTLSLWDTKMVRKFVHTSILPGMEQRLLKLQQDRWENNLALMTTVEAEDIDYSMFTDKENLFEQSMQVLNGMVGLQQLKQNLSKTFCQVRFNRHRQRLGLLTEEEGCHHMIFTGNPGTGKTTVAKMLGKLYHAMGIISKGELICTERSQIVGTYIGETEKNMIDLLEQAQGNVLFIDEAYTLYNGKEDKKDFGQKAIECLLTVLSKKHPDMIVIMAGYDKEMKQMLEVNQGLKGRFPHHFHFDNYSADELMQIALNLLRKQEYRLTEEAESLLRKVVTETVAQSDRYFSNARWMERFLTHGVFPAIAERIMAEVPTDDRIRYQTIVLEDIEQAYKRQTAQTVTMHMPRRSIGFTA